MILNSKKFILKLDLLFFRLKGIRLGNSVDFSELVFILMSFIFIFFINDVGDKLLNFIFSFFFSSSSFS